MDDIIKRKEALDIIQNWENRTDIDVYKAVLDLRFDARHGDEALLYPLLNHDDEMVVAAALCSLIAVYDKQGELKRILFKFAEGDPRDTTEMPIQCAAIRFLADIAKTDQEAYRKIQQVAENVDTTEVPMARAWSVLAKLHGLKWEDKYSDIMIEDPNSEKSKELKKWVREAIDRDKKGK